MPGPLADQIIQQLKQAPELYYRLILVVAPAGAEKTKALHEAGKQLGAPIVNVNLELSRRMLDLTSRQRMLQLPKVLREIVDGVQGDVVLLDNIEILFDVTLKQDPLRLLQSLSRDKTIVVAWSSSIDGDRLTYATPDHVEYRQYPLRDFLLVNP
mgnify:FL=1